MSLILDITSYGQVLEETIEKLNEERNSKNELTFSQNNVYSLFCPHGFGDVMMPDV